MVEELWVETEYEWSSFIQRKYIMENHYEVASIRNQFGNWVVVNVRYSGAWDQGGPGGAGPPLELKIYRVNFLKIH